MLAYGVLEHEAVSVVFVCVHVFLVSSSRFHRFVCQLGLWHFLQY